MRIKSFFENFILVAIVLVIVQTFLDDFSRISYWSVQTRTILLISGFVFDIIFSLEFSFRTFFAYRDSKITSYWLYKRGWVDFISSFPLLILNSGPAMYFLFFGAGTSDAHVGVFAVAKIAKAVRITRILRLLRIMKVFGKIQNASSKMAQHHVATITTVAVFTVICVAFGFSFISESADSLNMKRITGYQKRFTSIDEANNINKKDKVKIKTTLFENDDRIIKVEYKNNIMIDKVKDKFNQYFDNSDYKKFKNKNYTIYVSVKDINAKYAFQNIRNFIIIVMLVFSFMIIYTRHFVQNISDVIFVLNKGFKQKDYNLQVKINENNQEHEVFELAKFYNTSYLPAKIKKYEEKAKSAKNALSMNDLLKFKK